MILIDTDVKWPDDIVILMTCVIKDGNKSHLQLSSEHALYVK